MRRLTIALASSLVLVLVVAGSALGWVTPELKSDCAPDANSFAWTIHLHAEDNQNIEFSWASNFSSPWTVDFVTSGDHSFTTARGGETLYARYVSDHNAATSALADGDLCEPPPQPRIYILKTDDTEGGVVDQGTLVTYTYTVSNLGNESLAVGQPLDLLTGSDAIACSPLSGPTGDVGDDDVMDPGEVWVFTCSVTLNQNHDNTACVTGQPGSWDGEKFYTNDEDPVLDCAEDSVLVIEGGRISAQAAPCSGPQSTISGIRFIGLLALLHVRIDNVPVVPDADGDVPVAPGLHSWEVRASNDATVLASGDVTVPTCQEGGTGGSTGTPAASLPNSAVSSTSTGSPLAAFAFGLLLLSSLGALAFVNVRSTRRR